jgi:hypothetical protein
MQPANLTRYARNGCRAKQRASVVMWHQKRSCSHYLFSFAKCCPRPSPSTLQDAAR